MSQKISIFTIITFLVSNAYSMSCGSWSSGNIAARPNNAVVVKVRTLTLDPKTRASSLMVEKVYKGDPNLKIINLPEDDLGYSTRIAPEEGSWIGIFAPNDGETYYGIGCAEEYFSINSDGKVNVQVSAQSTLQMSELEFEDYIMGKSFPTLSNLSCMLNFSYREPAVNESTNSEIDQNTQENVNENIIVVPEYSSYQSFEDTFKVEQYTDNNYVRDLSLYDPNFTELIIKSYMDGYQVRFKINDPLSGLTESSFTFDIDPAQNTFKSYDFDLQTVDDKASVYVSCMGEYARPMIQNEY